MDSTSILDQSQDGWKQLNGKMRIPGDFQYLIKVWKDIDRDFPCPPSRDYLKNEDKKQTDNWTIQLKKNMIGLSESVWVVTDFFVKGVECWIS